MTGPAVYRRQDRDPGRSPQQPGDQVRFVVVRVDDVDAARRDEPAELSPNRRIEGVSLEYLDVIDVRVARAFGDAEPVVAPIADVAHGDGIAAGVGEPRAVENRLLRPAARAPNAAELKNANWPGHAMNPHGCGERGDRPSRRAPARARSRKR